MNLVFSISSAARLIDRSAARAKRRPPDCSSRAAAVYGAAVAVIALAGCGNTVVPDARPDSDETFVAFVNTFADFRQWPSVHDLGPADDGTYAPVVLGPRTQYLNQAPRSGSKTFPVGTVIVEARENSQMLILAAAKRGGNFNSGGAADWEWFELAEDPDSKAVSITWRGTAAPSGTSYGGIPTGDCNTCHVGCGYYNDYVCSPELQLGSF